MPREIIDTASSRPAYVRRRIITAVLYVVLVAALVAAGWTYWTHRHAPGAAVPTTVPGNSSKQGNLAPVPVFRRVNAA